MTDKTVGALLRELDAKATPAPWQYTPDSAAGKDEAWCHWHHIGPLGMTGEEGTPDTLMLLALRNALLRFAAVLDAADAMRCLSTENSHEALEQLCKAIPAYDAALADLREALEGGPK